MSKPWRTFEVRVDGFAPYAVSALTRGRAMADAFSRFREPYPDVTFGEFLRRARVSGCPVPSADGYDYVRRNYGLVVKVGQRVTLQGEGPRLNGRAGEVVYPGTSTAHVHIVLDGEEHVSRVHPYSIVGAKIEEWGAPAP